MTEQPQPQPQLQIDTTNPALVTGATGYIAGRLIETLLAHGVTVHATVRDPSKKERLRYLQDLADDNNNKDKNNKATIKFFEGDLLKDGSYADAIKGCSVVFHTASPFSMSVDDPQRDLVDPAVQGTRNVLNEATKCGTVQRVVVTSSVGAIWTDATDTFRAPNGILDEEVYNMSSSLTYQPYFFSKTMAEHAAWQVAGSQTQWTLVTINPAFVLGPGVKYHPSSESYQVIKSLGDGQMQYGVPKLSMGVVDVREVAQGHVVAAYGDPTVVKGRFLLCAQETNLYDMSQLIRNKYPDYPIASRAVPKFAFKLIAPYLGLGFSREYVEKNVDISELKIDNTKSKEQLGIKYRPLDETMNDMFQQLIDEGVVVKKSEE